MDGKIAFKGSFKTDDDVGWQWLRVELDPETGEMTAEVGYDHCDHASGKFNLEKETPPAKSGKLEWGASSVPPPVDSGAGAARWGA